MSTSHKPSHGPATPMLALAGALCAFFAAGVDPAMALCKYGTPNCVNPNPGRPPLPTVGGVKIPDSNWVDPDCKYYGNCNSARSQARPSGAGGVVSGGKLLIR